MAADGLTAIVGATQTVYPAARQQRRLAHWFRNLEAVTPRFRTRWRWTVPEMVQKFQFEMEEVLALFNFRSQWRHRLRTTNLSEDWFKHLRRYLSRFPGCRNAERSERVLGCFLPVGELMH